jgi:ubiquinone/menaquinone biosynthesis C-methylase UbiE
MTTTHTDLAAVKQRQQQVWSAGDFSLVAIPLVVVSEHLCETVDLRAGQRVLDVACGSGNTAIAAARRNTSVDGIDYVPALLERARERAQAERIEIEFREGDAEALPFPDGAFDVVLSTFGNMFAPDHRRSAAELLRVCRPGGRIGLACWTPDGKIGEMFRLVTQVNPPPAGLQPPMLWGTEAHLRDLFGEAISDLQVTPRTFFMRYQSPEHWLEFHQTHFGPLHSAFGQLAPDDQQRFAKEMLQWLNASNIATDDTLVIPCDYLEIVATRRAA